jgi:hypothetical protein
MVIKSLKEGNVKIGIYAEDTTVHRMVVVWTGLETEQMEEGAVLEIQVAGHWIEAELERDSADEWCWRDLESGWALRRTNAVPIGVRKDYA